MSVSFTKDFGRDKGTLVRSAFVGRNRTRRKPLDPLERPKQMRGYSG